MVLRVPTGWKAELGCVLVQLNQNGLKSGGESHRVRSLAHFYTTIYRKMFTINNDHEFREWSKFANISIVNTYIHKNSHGLIIICSMMS